MPPSRPEEPTLNQRTLDSLARCALRWPPMNARRLRHVGNFYRHLFGYILYPVFYERQQRRLDKKPLGKMREDFAKQRQWDVAKGQWIDGLGLGLKVKR
jgi:hypothetical protein